MVRWKGVYGPIRNRLRIADGVLEARPGNLLVTSSMSVRMYRLAFESKGPVLVRMGELHGLPNWSCVLVESPRGEGVTACLKLPAQVIEDLRRDTNASGSLMRRPGASSARKHSA